MFRFDIFQHRDYYILIEFILIFVSAYCAWQLTNPWLQCTFNWIHQVNSKLIWFQLPKHAHEKGHDITPLLVPFFDNSQSSRGRSANPTIIWPPSLPCPLLTTTDWRSRFLKRSEKIPAFLWVFPSHSISQLVSLEIKCLICPIQSSDTSILTSW